MPTPLRRRNACSHPTTRHPPAGPGEYTESFVRYGMAGGCGLLGTPITVGTYGVGLASIDLTGTPATGACVCLCVVASRGTFSQLHAHVCLAVYPPNQWRPTGYYPTAAYEPADATGQTIRIAGDGRCGWAAANAQVSKGFPSEDYLSTKIFIRLLGAT